MVTKSGVFEGKHKEQMFMISYIFRSCLMSTNSLVTVER